MKGGGILEVILVNAREITHTNILGTPAYYVTVECGNQTHKSKISTAGKDKTACWNEKFGFEIPASNCRKFNHIKFRIMDTELFSDSGFVGQVIVHLGGIISEGCERGFIEVKPAPYNVVLEDDTYKGQIKIGFKFFTKMEEADLGCRVE